MVRRKGTPALSFARPWTRRQVLPGSLFFPSGRVVLTAGGVGSWWTAPRCPPSVFPSCVWGVELVLRASSEEGGLTASGESYGLSASRAPTHRPLVPFQISGGRRTVGGEPQLEEWESNPYRLEDFLTKSQA